MKTLNWFLFAALLFFGPSLGNGPDLSQAQEAPNAKKTFQNAVEALGKRNYTAAEKGFNLILASDPENLKATYYLALAKYQNKEIAEAEGLFAKVQKRSPENPATHYYLGCIAYDHQDWKKTGEEMAQVQKLDPQFAMASYYLGLVDYQSRKFKEARRYFEDTLAMDPSSTLAIYALAYVLLKDLKQPEQAQQKIDQALSLSLDDIWRSKLIRLRKETEAAGAVGGPDQPEPLSVFDMPAPPNGRFFFHPAFDQAPVQDAGKSKAMVWVSDDGAMMRSGKLSRLLQKPGLTAMIRGDGFITPPELFEKLGLTEDQKQKTLQMVEFHSNEIAVYFDKIHLDEDDLNLALKKGANDSELEDKVEKWWQDNREISASEDRFQQKLVNLLTLPQKAQLELLGGFPRLFDNFGGDFLGTDDPMPSITPAHQP